MEEASRKQSKSEKHYKSILENKKRKRKLERKRKRMAYVDKIRPIIENGTYTSKRILKEHQKNQFVIKSAEGFKFCIDCSYENLMSPKECNKFAQQLCRLYGANRKSSNPLNLHLINLQPSGRLVESCRVKCDGFDKYMIGMHEGPVQSVFEDNFEVIYLSPDSEEPLTTLSSSCVYIIGCLVDEHVLKGKSLEQGKQSDFRVLRLPIQEFCGHKNMKSPALAINQVIEIMLAYLDNNKDWKAALSMALPPRFMKFLH